MWRPWDPRGFASKVIVPWNQDNQSVLGASTDPYVSNPLRRLRLDDGLPQMADPEQWGRLCKLLGDVQTVNDPCYTETVLRDVLLALHERLRDLTFEYLVPLRVSLRQAADLVGHFLAEASGGDRGLAVVAALFSALAPRVEGYHQVRRGMINAADAATSSAGDIECVDDAQTIVLAVEVKEKLLFLSDIQAAVAKARRRGVTELLLCTQGFAPTDQQAIQSAFEAAWASGTNLYHATIRDLMFGMLPLLGADIIHRFVTEIGLQLDKFSTQPKHRKRWKTLLEAL